MRGGGLNPGSSGSNTCRSGASGSAGAATLGASRYKETRAELAALLAANLAAVPGSSQRRDGGLAGGVWGGGGGRGPRGGRLVPSNDRSITFESRSSAVKSSPEHAGSRRGASRQLATLAS